MVGGKNHLFQLVIWCGTDDAAQKWSSLLKASESAHQHTMRRKHLKVYLKKRTSSELFFLLITVFFFDYQMQSNLLLTPLLWLVFGLAAQTIASPSVTSVTILEPALAASSLEATDDATYDLDKAESKGLAKEAPKLEIIKQIRRLNSDGSYTVGYEADDGTFKIESRDVLGNVKGTYGYVDVNGEIKRVSYTAGVNATAGSRTTARPDPSASTTASEEVVQIPKVNRTAYASATTRRPSYVTTSQSSSTRATVIQAIPKKRAQLVLSSSERPIYNHYASTPRLQDATPTVSEARKAGEPTTTIVYATSAPTSRSPIILRPTALPGGSYKTNEQLSRPDKLEITDHVSKVQISSNRDTSTTKPVTELSEEREPTSSEKRHGHGNFVRRQLGRTDHDEELPAAQQQVIYSQSPGDDSSHVYSGSTGTSRPIFNSLPTRIPAAVLSARSRVAQLQNSLNNHAKQQQQSEKAYAKPPRRRPESRAEEDQTTAEPSSENRYVAQQRPVSVQIVAPASSRDDQQATEEDKRVYRRPVTFPPQQQPQPVTAAYRNHEFVRQAPPTPDFDYGGGPRQFRIPIPQAYPHQYQQQPPPPHAGGYPRYVEQPSAAQQAAEDEDQQQQYLRETTGAARPMAATPAPYAAGNDPDADYASQAPRPRGRQYLPYAPPQQRGAEADYEQPSHQVPYPQNPYSPYNRPPLPSQYYNHPDRPLTARDFERLLNLLIVRHQQLQRYPHLPPGVNPYLLGGGHGGGYGGQPPYNQFGYQQIPRPPIHPYDYRPPALYGEFSDQNTAYQPPNQSPSAAPDHQQPAGAYPANRPTSRHRQRAIHPFYAPPEYSDASQTVAHQQNPTANQVEYLPPDIREELLYRMLLLAMQPEEQQQQSQHLLQHQQPAIEQGEASSISQYSTIDQKKPPKTSSSKTITSSAAASSSTSKPTELSGTTATQSKFRKPVRSVQILGEEE